MIKKAGHILIMILLLIATGGIPVSRHYCGTKAMSFSVFSMPKPCCRDHCDKCHTIFKFSRVNDNFETGASITSLSSPDVVSLHATLYIDLFDKVIISPIPVFVHQRAIFNHQAGHSPASLGNFRC